MTVVNHPPLRDLASPEPRLAVDVHSSLLFDMVMALWTALGGDDKVATHELGAPWFEQFRRDLDDRILHQLARFGADAGWFWMALLGVLTRAPVPATTHSILTWLTTWDGVELRAGILAETCSPCPEDTVESIARGDTDALPEVLVACGLEEGEEARASLERLVRFPAERLAAAVADATRMIWEGPFAEYVRRWQPAVARSATATRLLSGSLDPVDLIDRVTNGISYAVPLGTTRLVLIPSVTIRPWTVVSRLGGTLLVCYPVADEHLEADPDAPPAWLVRIHKALGDERRLRMLRRLGEGEATLRELTNLVGLAKSTVFHHLGVLRGAGLVRVRVSKEAEGSVYSLREEALAEAPRVLVEYLTASGTNEDGGRS